MQYPAPCVDISNFQRAQLLASQPVVEQHREDGPIPLATKKLDEATTAVGEKANGAIAAAVDQAKDRRVRRAVRTDQGQIIVPEGQIVTERGASQLRSLLDNRLFLG